LSDLIIPGSGLTPAGGVLVPSSGQTIRAEAGVSKAIVFGGLYLPPTVTGVTVDPSVCFKAGPTTGAVNAASVVQWCSPSAAFHGEVDISSLPLIGVQFNRYSAGSPAPSGNIDRALVHNNTPSSNDKDAAGRAIVGLNHAFYFRDAEGVTGSDVRTEDIWGGGSAHFYPSAKNNVLTNWTSDGAFALVYFWGSGATGNKLLKVLSLSRVGRSELDGIVRGGGETNNVIDYVLVPTPGYGTRPS
jgi:hypothetical protein